MRTGVEWFLPVAALAFSVASAATCAAQDSEYEPLSATKRLFPGIGPGLRAVRHLSNGNYCVLAAPTPGLTVFNPQGKPLLQIGPPASEQGSSKTSSNAIVYGEDADVDSVGRIYVADRGTNTVKIFSPTGELLRSITVAAPISLVVSSGGEIAVTSLNSPHLVTVFDGSGKVVREFGDPLDIAERAELNRFLNIGRVQKDSHGNIYYGFTYLPDATVRQYDSQGYGGLELRLAALDFHAVEADGSGARPDQSHHAR